jgi:hypothetical protein
MVSFIFSVHSLVQSGSLGARHGRAHMDSCVGTTPTNFAAQMMPLSVSVQLRPCVHAMWTKRWSFKVAYYPKNPFPGADISGVRGKYQQWLSYQ